MKQNFRENVRSGTVKSPIQFGFKKAEWEALWENSEHDSSSEMLYDAGNAIYEVLEEIRKELKNWFEKNAPAIGNGDLLRYYCGLPNRDKFIAIRLGSEQRNGRKDLFGMTTNNNAANNELSLVEVAEGTVDGIQKAILGCISRMSKGEVLQQGSAPLDLIEFIKGEANLSQIYNLYEEYWNGLLWGGYEFRWINKCEKIAEIRQLKNSYEIAFELSQVRRMRLAMNSSHIAGSIYPIFDDKYVTLRGSGRQKRYVVENIRKAGEQLQFSNAVFKISASKLEESLPASFLRKKYLSAGITVFEILEIFRIFNLLSISLIERYPKNDVIPHADALLAFSPKIDVRKLSKAIVAATGINDGKVTDGLRFLSYKSQKDDLWCQPILHIDDNYVAVLTAAFSSPNILRMVEHWLVKLDVNLAEKGYFYEGSIVEDAKSAMSGNSFANNVDGPATKRVKIKNGEEEIDFLLRVGRYVIVGEAKSIISTDSPLSYFRTWQILEKAADQALRKVQFVENNLAAIFEKFGFTHDPNQDYLVSPLILNSNRMNVVFPVKGVPVCDERTLVAYFEKRVFPIFSVMKREGPEHLAWLEVYSDEKSFEENFYPYLNNLPQVQETSEDFELKETYIPTISDKSLKLVYRRLLPKEPDLIARLKRKYYFPLKTVENIHERLAEVDIII